MIDMRNYREALKGAIKIEREADENWSWRLDSVTKGEARIGWGYLDYLGEKDKFTVEIESEEDCLMVIGTLTCGTKSITLVGNEFYHDCSTIDEGIRRTVHHMALMAHERY